MRWLRRPPDDGSADASLEEAADLLRAAAHEAPSSPRAEEVRELVLARVAGDERPRVPGLVPVAITALVLLVTLAIGVGAPAVGTFLESVRESATPIPSWTEESDEPQPSPPAADDLDVPLHPGPSPSTPPTPAPGEPGDPGELGEGGDPGPGVTAPATPRPPATPMPSPSDVPVPTPIVRPSGPPSPLPTPPSPSIPPPSIPAP